MMGLGLAEACCPGWGQNRGQLLGTLCHFSSKVRASSSAEHTATLGEPGSSRQAPRTPGFLESADHTPEATLSTATPQVSSSLNSCEESNLN